MKIATAIFLIFIFCLTPVSAEVITSLWRTEKSQHFIIYYQEVPADFVNELISKAEEYYNGILEELGFRRFDFWSWDNRAKIYLYNNSADYLKDTNSLAWSGAQVSIKRRIIKTFVGQQNFFDSILPHEMTHMIFREFVGLKTDLPLWIDEGVACSQEKNNLAVRMNAAKVLVKNNTYLEFKNLFEVYSATLIVADIFYSQAASVITFLLNKYDKELFLDFSRKVRDGLPWKKALLDSYRFSSAEEMQTAWKEFMLKQGGF